MPTVYEKNNITMILPPKKYFPVIAMISTFVMMILLAWLGIAQLKNAIWEKMNDIQKFHTNRENRNRQIDKLPELKDQFEAIKADEGTLDILLSDDRIVSFIKMLENLAQETHTGISITSKESGAITDQPKTTSPKKAVASGSGPDSKKDSPSIMDGLPYGRYLRLNISLVGKYSDSVAFLHKMETLPYALDIVSIDAHIKPADDASSSAASGTGVNLFMSRPVDGNGAANDAAIGEVMQDVQLETSIETLVYMAQ